MSSTQNSIQEAITFYQKNLAKENDEAEKISISEQISTLRKTLTEILVDKAKVETATTAVPKKMDQSDKADFRTFERNLKKISVALNDIPQYNGININETEKYVSKLNQYFSLLVTEVDPNLETEFLSQIKLKLGENVWKHLNMTKPDVSTSEKYKIFY